jgi:hypothetical protein
MNFIGKFFVVLLVLSVSACATVHDLNAPCRDFGARCHQERINFTGIVQ